MRVRCGRCSVEFDAEAGRHPCPACGTLNEVRLSGEEGPAGGMPPPAPDAVVQRAACPECGFSFIVGGVDEAPCPNCRSVVTVVPSEGGS